MTDIQTPAGTCLKKLEAGKQGNCVENKSYSVNDYLLILSHNMYILVSNCPQQTLGSKINEINKIVPLIAGEATPATCQAKFF